MKLAIFDIDDTIYEGNSGIDFLKVVIEKGLFDKKYGLKIFELYQAYKSNEISRADMLDEVYKTYAKGVDGLKKTELQNVAKEVWDIKRNNLFLFTEPLCKLLKGKGFNTIAISGSASEMVDEISKEQRFGRTWGADLEVKDGICTGRWHNLSERPEDKYDILMKFTNEHNLEIDWDSSFAFGDSENEQILFEKVGNPIVLEPHPSFKPIAEKKKWIICNRDNILSIVKSRLGK